MRMKITLFLLAHFFCFHQIQAQCDGADFEEKNGIAIMELDSKVAGSWRKESISGASGGAALTYRGTDYFNSPGNSTITYKVKINSSGTYKFIWRNKISIIASSAASTEHNDAWLKILASNFYGQRGSSRIYPGGSGKSPVAKGATSGGWFKVYTNSIPWSWSTNTSDNDAHEVYATFNSPGVYSIQVSGRSKGHSIDRMVLFKEGSYSDSQAQSLARRVTSCSGSTSAPTPPPPSPTPDPTPTTNQAPTVSITSPSAGQNITAGNTVSVGVSANDADGSIVKHEVFVNNVKVDTDGSSYTPHIISNIQPGNYAIRATVTDNGGKTASSTVNFSVSSGSGPTPNPTPPTPPTGNLAPNVNFISPSAGQSFTIGDNVSINLSASDSDGTIIKHQIFVNNVLVDTDGTNFTPHIISKISAGTYAIRATVTDNDGKTASSTVNFSVTSGSGTAPNPTPPTPPSGNLAPSVNFISPSAGQSFTIGDNVSINLSASDSDGTIIKHQIFVNNVLVDTDGTNFTPHIISKISAGTYAIRATVTDNDGKTASSTVNFNVTSGSGPAPNPTPPTGNLAPSVNFISPSAGQNFNVGDNVAINLSASDADGTVVKYQIFVNNVLVDTDGTFFTPHIIQKASAGSYAIRATVTDNDGKTTSISTNITVGTGGSSTPPTAGNSAPTVQFTSLTEGQLIPVGSTVFVEINANDTDGSITKYQVYINNKLVDTDGSNYTAHPFKATTAGNYTIKVVATDNKGATGTAQVTITIGSSSSSSAKTATAFAFPNPVQTDGKVSIRLPEGSSGEFYYSVTNGSGVQVEQGNFKAKASESDIDLQLSNVGRQSPGIYYLTLKSINSVETIPIVRQ